MDCMDTHLKHSEFTRLTVVNNLCYLVSMLNFKKVKVRHV